MRRKNTIPTFSRTYDPRLQCFIHSSPEWHVRKLKILTFTFYTTNPYQSSKKSAQEGVIFALAYLIYVTSCQCRWWHDECMYGCWTSERLFHDVLPGGLEPKHLFEPVSDRPLRWNGFEAKRSCDIFFDSRWLRHSPQVDVYGTDVLGESVLLTEERVVERQHRLH